MGNRRYNNRNQGNYQNRGNRDYNQGGNGNNNQQDIKKSGATYTKIKQGKNEGLYAVNAWRKTKFGLQTAKAFPVHSDTEITSKDGNEFVKYAVEVANQAMGTSQTYWCLMSTKTRKIFIKELGLIISPNGKGFTGNGVRVEGYFGRI